MATSIDARRSQIAGKLIKFIGLLLLLCVPKTSTLGDRLWVFVGIYLVCHWIGERVEQGNRPPIVRSADAQRIHILGKFITLMAALMVVLLWLGRPTIQLPDWLLMVVYALAIGGIMIGPTILFVGCIVDGYQQANSLRQKI